ncbi:MAG: protease modulator HflC [Clostridia bacterium]|nr:protease modulator HflC [Clostridia bacterium]
MEFNTNNVYDMKKDLQLKRITSFIKPFITLFVAFILLAVLFNSFTFTVDEREQVIVKQFNEVVKVIVDEKTKELEDSIRKVSQLSNVKILFGKGIYFKVPFLQTTEKFTNMLLTYDTESREVITRDKKKLVLDNYAQWKIENPALFVISLKNERAAHTRLDDIIYSKMNEEIGKVDAHVVIADKKLVGEMLKRVTDTTNEQMKDYGIKVIDIRIKRTDLPVANYNNIFNRMKTERERAAKAYRSEGSEEAQKIRSAADKEATILQAKAYEEAEKIKGEGDAEALKIYADAYNKDPEFYAFWRTLQTYKATLKDKTRIVIDSKSEFAKYLFNNK